LTHTVYIEALLLLDKPYDTCGIVCVLAIAGLSFFLAYIILELDWWDTQCCYSFWCN